MSLRSRLVLIGTAGLAAGLFLGGLLLISVLHLVLLRAVDTNARQTADDVVALVDQDALADPIPTAGTQYVQALDANGQVRAASVGADRLAPLLTPAQINRARAGNVVVISGSRLGQGDPLRVVARDVSGRDQVRTVLVATPAHQVDETTETVRDVLAIAYPLIVAALAALAWRVIGATLRPVEALRAGAEEISAAQVGRLPVPGAHDEIRRLAVTLNDMLARLEAARSRQRAFVADAAHELRSPITSLRTQLDVAEHVAEPASVPDLRAEVDRLGSLVDDLLLLARADEGDPALRRREPVDLGAMLRDVAAAHGDARVPVTVLNDGDRWASGDPGALRRVAANLVGNAVRHAATRVTLGTTADGFSVVDDGPGIPAADRNRVFERFTRLDDARARDDGGAGLGLAIVREMVRAHDGEVTLADAEPGLRVTVALPALAMPD